MKISKTSWHYKLNSAWFDYPSYSLCVYFWQVVWSVVVSIAMVVVLVGMVTWAASPFWQFIWPHALGGSVVAAAGIFDCLLLSVLWYQYRNYLRTIGRLSYKVRRARQPTLFEAWLKAKKEKVCPRLEFVVPEVSRDHDSP